jgi:hypothetical protein
VLVYASVSPKNRRCPEPRVRRLVYAAVGPKKGSEAVELGSEVEVLGREGGLRVG